MSVAVCLFTPGDRETYFKASMVGSFLATESRIANGETLSPWQEIPWHISLVVGGKSDCPEGERETIFAAGTRDDPKG